MRAWAAIAFAPGCGSRAATAGNAAADDRSQYWLFNPTPGRLLREMTSDGPDTTESPFTVDAGRVQTETALSVRCHDEYPASAPFSYEWSERLGTCYEIAARLHTQDPRGDVVLLATGVTHKARKDLQLDAGVNVGVTPAADRVNPFIGATRRF